MSMLRPDHKIIAEMIPQDASVLDVGCGEGEILELLKEKGIKARGIDIEQDKVTACLKKGLSAMQGNADIDLAHYPDKGFDYVILTQVLQVTRYPNKILEEVLRIADRAIVSIPNFGYWENRTQLLLNGRMPVTKKLSYEWYETPNIHFCTIRDFVKLCNDLNIKVEKNLAIEASGKLITFNNKSFVSGLKANLLGQLGIFELSK